MKVRRFVLDDLLPKLSFKISDSDLRFHLLPRTLRNYFVARRGQMTSSTLDQDELKSFMLKITPDDCFVQYYKPVRALYNSRQLLWDSYSVCRRRWEQLILLQLPLLMTLSTRIFRHQKCHFDFTTRYSPICDFSRTARAPVSAHYLVDCKCSVQR